MASRVYPIDWREELAQLGPYLKGRGGVVRVRYAGERCAPSAFLATLTSEYEFKDDNRNWQSIRIDHQVYSVRYLSGIRDEFLRYAGVLIDNRYNHAGHCGPGRIRHNASYIAGIHTLCKYCSRGTEHHHR